ncbi:MAG: sigma-70 family RNA polymerase sigma factor [Chloroflexota bacterium]
MDWEEIYCRLRVDNNDIEAWLAVERRVKSWGRAVFWSRGAHVVQDAVADTCAAVALNLGDARGPDTFAGFVYGHFLNVRRRVLRGVPTWMPLEGIELPAPDQEEVPDPEQVQRLQRALAELPSRERTAVVLRYFEDCPSARIAAELGVTDGNARRILYNGLRRLRTRLHSRRVLAEPDLLRT